MAAIGTLPVLLGTGIHASRPAASAVGKGGLYSCSTHSLVYQTDGSSWTTWASLTGTGLADPGAATSYTPALTASSVNPTLGSGSSVEGHYIQLGKLVHVWGKISFGSSGAAAGTGNYSISLPVNAITTNPRVMGSILLYDDSAPVFHHAAAYYESATVFRIAVHGIANLIGANTVPWTWANNDALIFNLMYEAA